MAKVKNWTKYKEDLIRRCAELSPCFSCPARETCDTLSKAKGINKVKDDAPCLEAWKVWAEKTE